MTETMVRLTEEEHELLKRAKIALIRNGLNTLPAQFKAYEEVKKLEQDEKDRFERLALGILVALGAAALLYLILKGK